MSDDGGSDRDRGRTAVGGRTDAVTEAEGGPNGLAATSRQGPPGGSGDGSPDGPGDRSPDGSGDGRPGSAPLSRRQTLIVLSALLLGILLAALDQMIVTTALPTIVGELRGLEHMSWVVTSYLLASTVAMPMYGKLGDLYGRRPIYLSVIVIFLVGSVLCGMAQSMTELIIFRAIQGLGGGGLMLTAMATVGDIVPPRDRGRYQGLFGAVFGLASIVGPLVGGFFVDHLDWRWIFYINLPLGAAALIVTLLVLKTPKPEGKPRIDYLGALLIGGAVAGIVLVTSWGGVEYPWSSPVIILLGVCSALLLLAFALVETQVREPIIPLHLFRNPIVTVSSGVSFFVGFAMFGCIAFMPLFLQLVSGASATNSGLLLLPFMGGMIVSSMLSGSQISRTGRYRVFPIVGTAIGGIGLVLLSTMDPDTSRVLSGVFMFVLGGGIGLVMQTVVLATQNTVDRRDMGTATSTVTFARQIGASFGVAIFGAIFNNRFTAEIAERLPGDARAKLPPTSSITREMIDKLPPPLHDGLVSAFSVSLTDVFRYASPVLLLAFLTAFLLRDEPLRGHDDRTGQETGPGATTEPGSGTKPDSGAGEPVTEPAAEPVTDDPGTDPATGPVTDPEPAAGQGSAPARDSAAGRETTTAGRDSAAGRRPRNRPRGRSVGGPAGHPTSIR